MGVPLLLLTLLTPSAWSHPTASAHLHTQVAADCRDATRLTRTVQGLLDEARFDEADAQIQAAIACDAPKEAVALAQADWLLQRGQPSGALAVLDPWVAMEPSHAGFLRLRMRAHEALEHWALALNDAEALAEQGRSPEPWLHAIDLAQRAHGEAQALQWVDRAEAALGELVVFQLRRDALTAETKR